MRVARTAGVLTWLAAAAIAVSSCAQLSGSEQPASGTVTVYSTEPQNPLVPSNTNEVGGANVIDNIFTGLITYRASDGAPENAVATSITSSDQIVWDIKLAKDWTFHDGSPVTADSFIDAWNYGAAGKNAQLNQFFFEPIAGYEAVALPDATADRLSGLSKVNDYEFTVTLRAPNSQFPVMLGYAAFMPLPPVFFTDPAAFGERPIGNGPFSFVSWEKNTAITLARYDDYPLQRPRIASAVLSMFPSAEEAYDALLADQLDVLDVIPPSALADLAFRDDLDERIAESPAGVIQTITFPLYDKRFEDPNVRAAFSMAIDRNLIITKIFEGTRQAATGWVSPVVDGYKGGACGENCSFDPEKAKSRLAAADGFDGPVTIAYNADGGHAAWVDATCASITATLQVPCTGKPYPDFPSFRNDVTAKKMDGMFRTGWQMDYPSIENFLVPLYKTGASNNDGGYSNLRFDALMDEGASLPGNEGIKKFQEGEAVLASDMPVIPLWYGKVVAGYSTRVDNVEFTPFSRVNLTTIEVRQ